MRSTSCRPALSCIILRNRSPSACWPSARTPFGRQLVAALALVDEAGVLEHLRQLLEPLERAGGVVAEQVAGLVDVDLGELAGLGRVAEHVLELVEVADRLEHARHLAELHRVVAAEVLALVPRHVGERLLEVPRQLVHLPAEVHVLEQRLARAPGAARAARASSS